MAKYLSLRRAKPCHTWQNIGKLYVGIMKLIFLILSFPACSLPSQCSAVSWKQFCLVNVAVTRSLHVVYHFLKRERPVQEIHFFPASLICMEPLLSPGCISSVTPLYQLHLITADEAAPRDLAIAGTLHLHFLQFSAGLGRAAAPLSWGSGVNHY